MTEKTLYDSNSTMYVLGVIMRQPDIIHENGYILSTADFNGLHQILFGAMYNLSVEGLTTLKPEDIDLYLRQYSKQYEKYRQTNGYEYLQRLSELVDVGFEKSQFDYYYQRVKKFTILRDFVKSGIDIKEFYNPEADFLEIDKENEKLNGLEISQIFDRIRERIANVEDKNISKQNLKAISAGTGLKELVDELALNPEVGHPLDGDMLNFACRGARLGKYYLYSAPTGHGKALPNSVKIPLFNGGFKTVGEINIEDILIDRFGKPTKIKRIFPQGEHDVYEVIFKDGRKALCNLEHLWTYQEGRKRNSKPYNFKTKTLNEIIQDIEKNGLKNSDGFRIKVPMNKAVEYKKRKLLIHPYLIGLFLGDGSFKQQEKNNSLQFSTKDEELIKIIQSLTNWEIINYTDKNYNYYFRHNGRKIQIQEFLQDYPELINIYSYEKFIPDDFLYSSIEDRMELLQGLLDTDGTTYKNKVRFTTTSERMKDNFIQLIHSLGYIASLEVDTRNRTCYTIQIGAPLSERLKMFKLERKIKKIQLSKRSEKYEFNPIVSINKLDQREEMTCFLVDNEEHLFLMNDYIVTHNTRFLVGNACALSMPYIQDGKIIIKDHLAPSLFIATEMDPDEIQTLILSYVSGINEDKILNNTYSPEERKLIEISIKLIEDYSDNFRIEKISDPNISTVRSKIIKYILSDKIYNIFFDYIFTTPSLNMEFSRTGLREDVTLMMLSNTLKELAADYNVFMMSGTQVNRGWEKRQFRNENNIAGSKAIADKADFGMIALKLLDTELEEIGTLLKELDLPIPNVVIDIYKNRRGKIVNAKLFRVFDYGTCRVKDVLLTDTNYNMMHNLGKIEFTYKVEDLLEVITNKVPKKKKDDDDDEGGDK